MYAMGMDYLYVSVIGRNGGARVSNRSKNSVHGQGRDLDTSDGRLMMFDTDSGAACSLRWRTGRGAWEQARFCSRFKGSVRPFMAYAQLGGDAGRNTHLPCAWEDRDLWAL